MGHRATALLLLLASLAPAWAADGPSRAGPPPPTQASQAGMGFMPGSAAFLGVKLSPREARGATLALDGIQLRITRVAGHYEMEPVGVPGQKPADFKPPVVTITETEVTYDAGPMAVTWRMDQVFDLPRDWTTVEQLTGKGPLAQATLTIVRSTDAITVTTQAPRSRTETWVITPF